MTTYAIIFAAGIFVGAITVWLGVQIGLHMRRKIIIMVQKEERQQLL